MASYSSTLRIYHNLERCEYIVGSKSLSFMCGRWFVALLLKACLVRLIIRVSR